MLLRQGDAGDAVRQLQRGLNKLGALLLVDGSFGPGTRDAVIDAREFLNQPGPPEADDQLQAAVSAFPDPCPPLTAPGVTFIARAEVSGADNYRRTLQSPCWPGPRSGITIGIGYDCRFATADQIAADWGGVLPAAAVAGLRPVLGVVGSTQLVAAVSQIVVPLDAAMSVFTNRSLPAYIAQTMAVYPQLDALTPAQRTALVSLVYNRGPRLADIDTRRQDRLEMRTIADLLAADRLDEVAAQFEAMTRLWDPRTEAGLVRRRRDEATLWRSGFAALLLD